MVWSKSNLQAAVGPASRGLPGLVVWLCPKHAYELRTDNNFRPELEGEERYRMMAPIASWVPEVLL